MLRKFPIAWGFPMDEVIFTQFFENMPNLNIMPWDAIITSRSTYLPDARNIIHSQYVNASKDIQYLAMVDSDVLQPPNTVDILISHKKPLVGGWYHHKVPELIGNTMMYMPVVYDYINTEKGINNYKRRHTPGKGLEKVDGLGAGCLLMRRDLAEALGDRPYDMNAGGEDLVMCKKVYDLNYEIYVDWDLACPHIGVSYV
jgi:hypothetical protein